MHLKLAAFQFRQAPGDVHFQVDLVVSQDGTNEREAPVENVLHLRLTELLRFVASERKQALDDGGHPFRFVDDFPGELASRPVAA